VKRTPAVRDKKLLEGEDVPIAGERGQRRGREGDAYHASTKHLSQTSRLKTEEGEHHLFLKGTSGTP